MRFSCISESSVSMFKVNYMALLGPTLPKVNAAIMSPTKPNYFNRTLITNVTTQESNLSNLNNKGVDFISNYRGFEVRRFRNMEVQMNANH